MGEPVGAVGIVHDIVLHIVVRHAGTPVGPAGAGAGLQVMRLGVAYQVAGVLAVA